MSETSHKLEVTLKEYLEIQLRYAKFKLALKEKTNAKLRERVKTNNKLTEKIVGLLQQGKEAEVFNLMIQMNFHLTNENQSLVNCQQISMKHQILMQETVAQLTSKDQQVGDARTPEMHKFGVLMDSHCQMHCKQNWDNYEKYNTNVKNSKTSH